MAAERLTPRTIHFYAETVHAVAAILDGAGRHYMPAEVTPEDVGWLMDRLAAEGYTVQTRKGYISSLRKWCRDGGNTRIAEWPKPRFPADLRPNVDWLDRAQVEALLDHPMTALQAAVVALELRQGLRHVEVIRLGIGDIDFERHLLHVTGKGPVGGKPRTVPMVPETEKAIMEWMGHRDSMVAAARKARRKERADPENLIVWRKGSRICAYSEEGYGLDKVVSLRLSEELGFPVRNHALRRTFGRALFRAGVGVETIAKILGHQSTEVTLRYIGVDLDDMRSAMGLTIFGGKQ